MLTVALAMLAQVSRAQDRSFSAPPAPGHKNLVNVRDYGAVCNGKHDDTKAFRGALAAFPNGGVRVLVPPNCRITETITIAATQTHVEGEVPRGTFLVFAPVADGAAFSFHAAAGVDSVRNGISDLVIYSSDTRFTKTAIEIVAGSGIEVSNLQTMGVGPGGVFSGGRGSTALRIRGHQAIGVSRSNLWADRPISIEPNPNDKYIGLDHAHFSDLYLLGNGHPLIAVAPKTVLTNVTFDGYQAWVLGSDGFYMNDEVTPTSSANLMFRNVRWEQGTSPGGKAIYINRLKGGAQNVNIDNLCVTGRVNGVDLTGVDSVGISGYSYTGLEVGIRAAAVEGLSFTNVFLQRGTTALLEPSVRNISGTYRIGIASHSEVAGPGRIGRSPASGVNQLESPPIAVSQGKSAQIGGEGMAGVLIIYELYTGSTALVTLNGTFHSSAITLDSAGHFTAAAGQSQKFNVYWSRAQSRYEIENQKGTAALFYITLLGRGER